MNSPCRDPLSHNDGIEITHQTEQCTVYEMNTGDGAGTMTSYRVFPGITLTYNDFHTAQCPRHQLWPCPKDTLEINHCRQGRFECSFNNGLNTYLGEGDLAVNVLTNNRIANAIFPLKHYHGVSILVELTAAASMISTVLQDISIDLFALRERLCAGDRCFIIRATDSIQHIFSELYTIPPEIRHGYFKLKVLELLLFLSVLDTSLPTGRRSYFPISQVAVIKQIHQLLTQQMECHFTLEDLSNRFGIPLSALNACFKAVYGMPVYSYIRTYRLQTAAAMVRNTQDSVTVIAGNVGYENASKFAGAFKSVMQVSPSLYRKSN